VNRPDGTAVGFAYDAAGRLTAVTHTLGSVSYSYDGAGRPASLATNDGQSRTFSYDGFLLLSETVAGAAPGALGRSYDADFRLASESVNGVTTSFSYDADGLLTQAGALAIARDAASGAVSGTSLGSSSDAYSYDAFGALATYSATFAGAELFAERLERDRAGRIVKQELTVAGQTTVMAYGYDLRGRLAELYRNGVLESGYEYDANGNRTAKTTPTGTTTGSYDAQDRLLSYGAHTYTYAPGGELQTKTGPEGTTSYTYDALGNLRRVVLPIGKTIEYVIDASNRRIGKKVDGVLVQGFLYRNHLKPIAELDGAGVAVSRFIYGTNPLVPDYIEKGGQQYRIIADHLGSVRLVVDVASGAVAQRIDYDDFGKVMLDTNSGFQPFGFAGGLRDTSTGLTRFGARDYDAHNGRWSAKDPIGFAAPGHARRRATGGGAVPRVALDPRPWG
jgi:RHS repeat-associated protein